MSKYIRKYAPGAWYVNAFDACVDMNHDIALKDPSGNIVAVGSISKKQTESLLNIHTPLDCTDMSGMADSVFFLDGQEYAKQVDLFHMEQDEWLDKNYTFEASGMSPQLG